MPFFFYVSGITKITQTLIVTWQRSWKITITHKNHMKIHWSKCTHKHRISTTIHHYYIIENKRPGVAAYREEVNGTRFRWRLTISASRCGAWWQKIDCADVSNPVRCICDTILGPRFGHINKRAGGYGEQWYGRRFRRMKTESDDRKRE